MTLTAGTVQKLQVAREVPPNGYFLTDGESDVLLHYSEIVGDRPKPGDEIEVFLFHDTEDRLASTMKRPLLTLGELARLKVADIHPRLGCFLEMGLGRQLLLPLSELPELIEYRPLVGDEVFVILSHDKAGRMIAKLAREEDLAKRVFRAPSSWNNQWVEGWVTKSLQMGSFVLVDGGVVGFGVYGFIASPDRTRALRLGERVSARVSFIREDGRVNLSMSQRKEVGRIEDADRILAFLKERPGGAMPYSDETPSDIIKQKFGISKSAFKRAVGKLMRDGIVTQQGSWTRLADPSQAAGPAAGASAAPIPAPGGGPVPGSQKRAEDVWRRHDAGGGRAGGGREDGARNRGRGRVERSGEALPARRGGGSYGGDGAARGGGGRSGGASALRRGSAASGAGQGAVRGRGERSGGAGSKRDWSKWGDEE